MKLHNQQRKFDSLKGHYSEEAILEFEKQMQQTYDDQLKRITEMVLFMSMFFFGLMNLISEFLISNYP